MSDKKDRPAVFYIVMYSFRNLTHSIGMDIHHMNFVCSVAHFIYVSPVGGLAIYCMAWSTPFLVSLTIMFTCIIV